jgi:hypothetical protein
MELMSFGDGHPMLQRLAGSPGFRKSYSDYGFGALRDPNCLKCLHGACSSHAMELGNGLLVVHSPDGAQMHFGYAAQCSECSTAILASGGKPLKRLPRSAQGESRCVTYGFAGTGDWADPECEQCVFGCCSGHAIKMEEETPAESLSDTTGKEGIPVKEDGYDAVEPPHYRRGPVVRIDIGDRITKGVSTVDYPLQAIEVMRHIRDPRLATAFKYIWRVAFGGKKEPWDTRTQEDIDARDIKSAVWYLSDFLDNPVPPSTGGNL